MTTNFKITNITCAACIKLSDSVLKKIPGVTAVRIESDGLGAIESDRDISWNEIISALAEVDKTAELIK
ncbi:MAG: heavy-metal-associated domain-containing protein [Patescibacteria group bacterium]